MTDDFPSSFCVMMQVTIVKNEEGGNSLSTVVLRGSTDSILDDLERAVDDGVNTYKVISDVACFNKLIILTLPPSPEINLVNIWHLQT